MPALTPREKVCELVESSAAYTKKHIWEVWVKLYGSFEHTTNRDYRKLAHNAGQTPLEYIEEQGDMGNLMSYAQGYLQQDPAPKQAQKDLENTEETE